MKLWQIYTTGRFIALALGLLLSPSANSGPSDSPDFICHWGFEQSGSTHYHWIWSPSHNSCRRIKTTYYNTYNNTSSDNYPCSSAYNSCISNSQSFNGFIKPDGTWTATIPDSYIVANDGYNLIYNPIPACSFLIDDIPQCTFNGQTVTVGTAPGNYDKDYSQIVPDCPTGQSYILGSCSSLPIGLAALAGTLQTQWERLPNGVNQALGTHAAETLSEIEQLLAKDFRPAMSEFEKLLAKDFKPAMSEFERLLSKEFTPVAERVAANSGILAKAVPILNTAAWAYTGWELYEYGKVLLDQRETRTAFGGTCPAGWTGSDCDTPLPDTVGQYWPADDRPTYIYQPNNEVQPYVHHPRDPDRTVYDMTQTSPGFWEHVDYGNGATGDIYFAPTVSGPIIIERTEYPNRGGRVVTVTSLTTGSIRGYLPDSQVKPADFTAPGPITVINPPLANPSVCTPTAPNPDLTPDQHLVCRRQAVPKPITDPVYKPYPDLNPDPQTQPQPDKLIAPTPSPNTTPLPYSAPQPDPITGQMPSPFKVPDLNPTPNPSSEEEDSSPFGSCGCTLQPPDLHAPTLAETTDKLIERMNTGLGANVVIPTMTGECPILGVDLSGNQFGLFKAFGNLTTDVHCQILEQNRSFIQATAVLFALVVGLMIVLGP